MVEGRCIGRRCELHVWSGRGDGQYQGRDGKNYGVILVRENRGLGFAWSSGKSDQSGPGNGKQWELNELEQPTSPGCR